MKDTILTIAAIICLVAILLHIWKYSNYSTKKKIVMTVLLAIITPTVPLLVFLALCYWYRRFMPVIVGLFATYLLFAFLFSAYFWDFNGVYILFESPTDTIAKAWITLIGILTLASSLYRPLKQSVITKFPVIKQYGLSPLLYIIPACLVLVLPVSLAFETRGLFDLEELPTTFIMTIVYPAIVVIWSIARFVSRMK